MKSAILMRISFVGKSLLWAVCLYALLMLAFNWDEIRNSRRQGQAIAIAFNADTQEQDIFSKPQSQQASISQHEGVLKGVFVLVKSICGLILNK